jgi:transcriptional regulator with XRE-family HTH domain
MATAAPNPTGRRLELAARLRDLRTSAGKSLEDVASELMCSTAKISRLETGERGIQPRDVRDLCRFYGVTNRERAQLIKLAEEARKPGWWQDFRGLDRQTATFVALESAATEIRFAQGAIIPGLLQTEEYTRALLPLLRPPGGMPPDVVDEVSRLRERRKERLLRGDVQFHTVVDEMAIRREVGSSQVMLRQLDHLLELADMPSIEIQVIPFTSSPHPLLEGSFQHMLLGSSLSDVVFVEGLLGTFIIDDADHVKSYREIWDYMSGTVAHDADSTLLWLKNERHRRCADTK